MKLDEYLADFQGADPEEALEMLMEFGEQLPPLSPNRAMVKLPADCRIQECQTPVYLWVDIVDGKVSLEAHVPEQSPTVRGFVAMLVEGLNGATVADVNRVPDEILPVLGLQETLGMTRQRGFRGIISRIKREVLQATQNAPPATP